ncbi:YcnI family protein [Nakamurella deserti]|uniref:YcnI family copper-binding membrane protein n=1 Tax=Nakamurella deserti TaxID=2164074 RepID=UPI000DBE7AEB|nr:YcnI family protein [Nakamurella deserti]
MTQHHRSTARRIRRATTVLVAGGAALLLGAGTALAHVTVTPESVVAGGYTTIGFRVPNESDTANTTKVEIQLPADTPFGFVSAQQIPGWTIDVIETALPAPVTVGNFTLDEAVTGVTFTADGAGLPPHEFTVFNLLVGPVPDVASMQFPAVQTYDDGEVVSWSEPTPGSGEEPEHPAPQLTITPVDTATDQAGTESAPSAPATDTTARVLGIAGIVVGLAGVGTGLVLARGRRSRAVPDDRGAA